MVLASSRLLRERAFYGLIDPVIPRRRNPGAVLEVGPGSGWELGLLARVGWEAHAVELDPLAAARATRETGVPVRVGDFHSVVGEEEFFDLIYLSHVLEHLPDPRRTFEFIGAHLRPTGVAVLVYPNARGLGAGLWKDGWLGWDPPRHLVLPSKEGLEILAGNVGLTVEIRTRARGAAFMRAATRRIRRQDEGPVDVGVTDRVFSLLEGLLVTAGLPLGEEVVAVVRRSGRPEHPESAQAEESASPGPRRSGAAGGPARHSEYE